MATHDRDTAYTNEENARRTYTRDSTATSWFVGIIVALALLAIAYLVFSSTSTTPVDINNTPPVTAPATSG